MKRKENILADIIIHIILLLFTLSTLLPFVLTLVVSFSDERSVMIKGYTFTPAYLTADAYQFVLSSSLIFNAYFVTIFVTVVGTALSVFLCAMAAMP